MKNGRGAVIADACVLIDFMNSAPGAIKLIAEHSGPIHVASPIVDEVREIEDEQQLVELGLIVVTPELEDMFEAASKTGSLSFQDRLCLLTAKRWGFECATNDKRLRNACSKEDVPVIWGLELLLRLHKTGGISAADAIKIAKLIHNSNPRHVTLKILHQFQGKLKR